MRPGGPPSFPARSTERSEAGAGPGIGRRRGRLRRLGRALGVLLVVVLTLAVLVGLGLGLTRIGGDDGSSGSDSDGEADPSSTTSAPADYLPLPDGVELTEPGSALAVGESATVAWTPRQDVVGVVDVRVAGIDRVGQGQAERVFEGYQLTDAERASTPYLVTVRARNVGDTDLGARPLPIYGLDDTGRLLEPTKVPSDFAPCPRGVLPGVFAPGDKTSGCLVVLVPPGAMLKQIVFRPPEGVVPIVWTGDVEPYRPRREGRGADR